jgi:hypothetical protein
VTAQPILIGSELKAIADLKTEALSALNFSIESFENRYNTPDLSYFGLHTRTDLLQGANFLHKLYWHSRVPFHDERVGLIIAMRDGDQFLEVVGAVLAKMAWVRNRQKAFKFQPEAKTA